MATAQSLSAPSAAPAWTGPNTTVVDRKGRPAISLDGRLVDPFWFVGSTGWGRSCGRAGQNLSNLEVQVRASASMGFELVEVCIPQWQLDASEPDGIKPETRRVLDTVLKASAHAKIILRVLVEHITSKIVLQSWRNGTFINVTSSTRDQEGEALPPDGQGVSTVAGPWAREATTYLTPFMRALDTAYPGRIAGVHIAAIHTGEWNWPGMCTWDVGGNDFAADYSEPMRRQFCGDERNCTLPSAKARNTARTGNAFVCASTPTEEAARVVSHNRLLQQVNAHAIATLADALKALSGGKMLVVAFHGYTYIVADARLASFGHLQADSLIDHASVDGFVSPYQYFTTARKGTGALYAGGQVNTPWLRGKLWVVEDDTRTVLSQPNPFRFCSTMRETVDLLRRNLFTAALHSYALYWFDLQNKGWFGHKGSPKETMELWTALASAVNATRRLQLPQSQKGSPLLPAPQVAVFFDTQAPITQLLDSGGAEQNMDGSLTYLQSPGGSWPLLNASQEISHIGAPSRHFYLADLPRLNVSQIKLALFVNAFAPTNAQRSDIHTRFAKSNATLVFLGPAGLVRATAGGSAEAIADAAATQPGNDAAASTDAERAHGACVTDVDAVADLIGIAGLTPVPGGPIRGITNVTGDPLAAHGARFAHVAQELSGLTFGNPARFSPLFYWDATREAAARARRVSAAANAGAVGDRASTGVQVLGRYASPPHLPSLVAAETSRGYTAIYYGAPALPAALLRALVRAAGVHLYTSDGRFATSDSIDAHGNGLHVHAGPVGGTRTIRLPRPLRVDAEDGTAVCPLPCASFDASHMRAGESRLYFVNE